MHRLRPSNEDDDGANSDDILDDEHIVVTKDMLDDVLGTRIGGKSKIDNDSEVHGDGHHINSTEAVTIGREVWSKCIDSETTTQPHFIFGEENVKKSLLAAQQSRRKETKFGARSADTGRAEREAAVSNRKQATREDVQEWLDALKVRSRKDGRLFVNAKQFEAVAHVAHQVQKELPGRRISVVPKSAEPLRWVVHGGPGTGKSHVVKDVIKDELFDQVCHWQQGLDYQVVALQAVMADLLKGDTIHHACGIPVRKKTQATK